MGRVRPRPGALVADADRRCPKDAGTSRAGASGMGPLTLRTTGCRRFQLPLGNMEQIEQGAEARVAQPPRPLKHRGPPAVSAEGAPGLHPAGRRRAGSVAAHRAAVGDEEARSASPAGSPGDEGDRGSGPGAVAAPGYGPACVPRPRRKASSSLPGRDSGSRLRQGPGTMRVRWITQPLPGEVGRELFAGGPSYGAMTCPGRRTRPARFTGHYGPAAGKASLRHRESGCRSGPGAPGPRPDRKSVV